MAAEKRIAPEYNAKTNGANSRHKIGPLRNHLPARSRGQGEVYRAKDTRLDRTVAVKILPAHLSDNPEAKQRFEREARTISALNHPHICMLHDVGSQDGTDYLVMEYAQGETLDSRLQKGPLPLKQALEYGMQICDALEKAHRAGIVHRDLKPGNIMLTASGAKLLDFGLAKPATAMFGAQPITNAGNLTPSTPTMNLSALTAPAPPLTQQGTIVGTFQYMAPELLQGREADARSDIFSFGCVLYEMITGQRAFEGKSQSSVASAILEKDPEPITKIQPMAPAALDYVVQECIAKDPEGRWQSAADIARQLRWIGSGGSSVNSAPPARLRRRWRQHVLWAAVVAALLAALGWLNLRETAPTRTLRSYLPPPPEVGFDFTGDFSGPPVITADGTAVAFCARGAKERDSVWVQSLSDLTAKKLELAVFPFWSADGKFVGGFFAEGHLKKVPAVGGPMTVLAEAPNPRGGSWNQENVIIYEPDSYKYVRNADSDAQYASGFLLYHLQSALLAQSFDPGTGAVSGDPMPVANLVEYDLGTWHTTFAASQNGLLVYEPGSETLGTDLVWMDRSGKTLGKVAERVF